MPAIAPGNAQYVTNGSGGTLTHGQPVKEGNFVGVAIKQKARSWKDGYAVQNVIDASEAYLVWVKGEVVVVNTGVSSANKGDAVYITSANALTATSTGNKKYGRITEVSGVRGVPTGKVRIDLDAKDSF